MFEVSHTFVSSLEIIRWILLLFYIL